MAISLVFIYLLPHPSRTHVTQVSILTLLFIMYLRYDIDAIKLTLNGNDRCTGYGGAHLRSQHLRGTGRQVSELEASLVHRWETLSWATTPSKKDHCTLKIGQVCKLTLYPTGPQISKALFFLQYSLSQVMWPQCLWLCLPLCNSQAVIAQNKGLALQKSMRVSDQQMPSMSTDFC